MRVVRDAHPHGAVFEGELYAGRLERCGVAVRLHRYDGMSHGFFTMTGALPAADAALAEAAGWLSETLADPALGSAFGSALG